MRLYENIIIGAGQAGLSVAYYFRRYNIDYLILDQEERSGASWLHTWDGLRLFSPLEYSSLSGWQMPKTKGEYPLKSEFLDYLEQYEKKYNFPIERPVQVVSISFDKDVFEVITNKGSYFCKTLVSATGTYYNPFIPQYENYDLFQGNKMHSAHYVNNKPFEGQNVLIIGGGNSGAQILAEVSLVASTNGSH